MIIFTLLIKTMRRLGVRGSLVMSLGLLVLAGPMLESLMQEMHLPGRGGDAAAALQKQDINLARKRLAQLHVAPATSMAGYDRVPRFGRWIDADRDGCNTRAEILERDGQATIRNEDCIVIDGYWDDPYSGKRLISPGYVQIDHIVPLAEAWRSGASRWTDSKRVVFANDPLNLISVSGPINQSKGDRDPATWMPPYRASHVPYAARYVAVKAKYRLRVDQRERMSLARALAR